MKRILKSKCWGLVILSGVLLISLNSCLNMEKYKNDVSATENSFYKFNNANIQYIGRFYLSEESASFAFSGSKIIVRFEGTLLKMYLNNHTSDSSNCGSNYFNVIIDGGEPTILQVTNDDTVYNVASGLPEGIHTAKIIKRTEAGCGYCDLKGFELDNGKTIVSGPSKAKRRLEFVGNSITCGFGLESLMDNEAFMPIDENANKTYAAIASKKLNADCNLICYSGLGIISHTNPLIGMPVTELYQRIYPQHGRRWDFSTWMPDAVLINLGTNDFSMGIPDSSIFIEKYTELLMMVHEKNPKAKIICLDGPMVTNNWPDENNQSFALDFLKSFIDQSIQKIKDKGFEEVYHFSLSSQGDLGYGGQMHPNEEQNKKNGDELAKYLSQLFNWEII